MPKRLTEKQKEVLSYFERNSERCSTKMVTGKQEEFAKDFGITRQALGNHIRALKDKGYIRTGRGFINITEDGLAALGKNGSRKVVVLVKISQTNNLEKYMDYPGEVSYLIGDYDVMIETKDDQLNKVTAKLKKDSFVEESKVLLRREDETELLED